jgi:hypothetical protein
MTLINTSEFIGNFKNFDASKPPAVSSGSKKSDSEQKQDRSTKKTLELFNLLNNKYPNKEFYIHKLLKDYPAESNPTFFFPKLA